MTEETLFHEARQMPASERERFLAKACSGDLTLRQRIEILLEADDNPDSLLELKPLPDVTIDHPLLEKPGALIGPYKLLEQIGEGGMGVVFMAEQIRSVQRRVALKIIKAGMDTREVVARFEAERQALAMMDHPNIARVLDAGATDTGRPYFVMELVRGVPMTEFCNQKNLSIRERLELFVTVCQAVQHAHQKGIIHRDIKPTNVLVTLHDGRPMIKVIDFGVAKATGQKLTDKTLFTGFTQMVGTPLYMSPEQAEMTSQDIDTRSDIFSAGVLLYELLTGSTPFDKDRLKSASFDELRRIIREEEPPRPSTRLTTIAADAASTVGTQRKSDPRHLSRLFRGELDWIVMKCLEKDRTRRYETASALAGDVERYLHDEPVQACPPSARYRFGKFARRNKAALITVAAVIVALVLGTVVSTWQAIRAFNAKSEAKANAERTTAIAAFLVNAFRSPDPDRDGRTITVAEVLDRSATELHKEIADDPRTKAALLQAIGESYGGLGLYREAIPLLEQARALRVAVGGSEPPDALSAMHSLATAYMNAGRQGEAVALEEETVKLAKAELGPEHPDTLESMNKLASTYHQVMRMDDYLRLAKETFILTKAKLGPEHPDTLRSINDLAVAYEEAGRYDQSLPLFEESLKLTKAKLGQDDPATLLRMLNLANTYQLTGRADDADRLLGEAVKLAKAKLVPTSRTALQLMGLAAGIYLDAGRTDEAIRLNEQTLELQKAKLGADHPDTLLTMKRLALGYRAAGRIDDSLRLGEETLKLHKAKLGPEHPETLRTMHHLAFTYRAAGRIDEAISLDKETLKLRTAKLGPDDSQTLWTMHDLAEAYVRANRLAEAEPVARECLEKREKTLSGDWPTFDTQSLLGSILSGQKQYAEAEPLLVAGYEGLRDRIAKVPAYDKSRLKDALQRLVVFYETTNQPEKAAAWKAKLIEFERANPGSRKKVIPPAEKAESATEQNPPSPATSKSNK